MTLYRQIDKDGNFVADVFDIPSDADSNLFLDVSPAQGFYSPKWDGEKWVEGAKTPICTAELATPTEIQRITALEDAMLEVLLGDVMNG